MYRKSECWVVGEAEDLKVQVVELVGGGASVQTVQTSRSIAAAEHLLHPHAMQSARTSGSRLRPVADVLESVGFVSKGDKKYVAPPPPPSRSRVLTGIPADCSTTPPRKITMIRLSTGTCDFVLSIAEISMQHSLHFLQAHPTM